MRLKAPLFVFSLAFLVYSPTLGGVFYYDDNVIFFGHQVKALSENPFLLFRPEGAHMVPGAARSLHVFFLLLLNKVFGQSPFPFHLFNLTLHSLTSVLVYFLIRNLTEGSEKTALAGGLIFALHPIHTSNITLVTLGGTDLFYTLWALVSLTAYIKFRRWGPSSGSAETLRKHGFLVLSLFSFYFAILSKESAVSFIIMYPLTELFLGRRGFHFALPHLIALLSLKARFIAQSGGKAMRSVLPGEEGGHEVVKSLGFFIKSLAVPYPQSPIIKEFGNEWLLYGFAGMALAAVPLLAVALKRKRILFYSSGFFFVTSFPYLFAPYIKGNLAVTAERYIYAPSVGFALGLSVLLSALAEKERLRRLFLPAVSALLVIYSVLGVSYFHQAWRSREAFWRRVIRMNPDYVSGYIGLSASLADKGESRRVLLEGLKKPKGLQAEFSQAAHGIGTIELSEGNMSAAESYLLLSLKYGPYEFAFIDLGFIYLETGDPEKALWAFEGALRFPARNIRAVYGTAKACAMLGEKETALRFASELYERARDETTRAIASELIEELSR